MLLLVNPRFPRSSNASDFDQKSSASARQIAMPSAMRRDDSSREDAMQRSANYQFESSTARDAVRDAQIADESEILVSSDLEADETSPLAPEAEAPNYLGLNEEFEDEDVEEGEPEIAQAEIAKTEAANSAPINAGATREDDEHAEFERVFLQWKETNDPRLRERLILMNRSMVMFLARRFMDRGELFEDVMQVGMLGLIYALDGYNLDRGVKFSTFAIPTISGEIRRYFRDKVSGMRVPRGLQELHNTLQNKIEELTQQLDRSPTYAEIAFSLKIEVEQVVEAMELGAAIDPLSIDDKFFGEESATIAESIGAPDPQLHAYEEHAALQAALEKLPANERRVLEMSYFDGHSQAEIARRMNVSQMHISRLLRRSLAQLKQLLEEG